jgi:hypothetical protein
MYVHVIYITRIIYIVYGYYSYSQLRKFSRLLSVARTGRFDGILDVNGEFA